MKRLALLLAFYCTLAPAQALRDPTRPPSLAPSGEGHGSAGPQLQSVILSPTRRAAIISGQLVARGERYGDAVLAEVAQDYVVLRRGDSTEVLKLHPGGVKRQPTSAK
jgi:MSHA biogenesis protein MshK